MDVIQYNGQTYPWFQSDGNAMRFCLPFAKEICRGEGYDIGCAKQEWAFPGATPIDISFNNGYSAHKLPDKKVDYVISSHCLEHIPDWVRVLDYWISVIKPKGHIFLYLPDYSQEYWRPWNNKKHVNILTPQIISDYFAQHKSLKPGFQFVSGVDAYNSFTAFAQKGSW